MQIFQEPRGNLKYIDYFTYLNLDERIQSMAHTTNWVEHLQKDLRRITRSMLTTHKDILAINNSK